MMEKTFYGNTVLDWATALGIILGAFVVGRVAYWFFRNAVRKVTAKSKARIDDIVVDTIEEPLVFIMVIAGIHHGLQVLVLPETVAEWVGKGVYILVIVASAWTLTRLFDSIVKEYIRPLVEGSESDLDDQLLPIIRKGLKTVVWILAIIVALDNAGYDVGAVLAGLGIGGLAFAMAAQDTVKNLFGGFTIFTDRPFTVNDRIQVAGVDGTVKEIGVRSTRIVTLDGRTVTIPNSQFQDSAITNVSSEPSRKVSMTLGLTYDTSADQVEQAMAILREIVAGNQESLEEAAHIGFTEFGDFSLNVLFIYYIRSGADIMGVMTAVNLAIHRKFTEAGLELAFPTQTIQHKAV